MITRLVNWILNKDPEKVFSAIVGVFLTFWVFWVLFVLSLVGGLIYVAVHFISKYW